MSSEVTFSTITQARREPTSTAWFWWKESRQLAPLLVLLVIVALGIILINAAAGMTWGRFRMDLPSEIVLLVFPGLFATGAGPLLVGQERSQGTLNWLVLLPISARRLVFTKLHVAFAGLAVMWIFAFAAILLLGMSDPNGSRWSVGERSDLSGNPFSYPVWILHSIFILLCGFFVAWKIKNQFNSLMALIPLAFAPIIATSVIGMFRGSPMLTDEIDWYNLITTLIGVAVMAPLTFHSAIRSLAPAPAPRLAAATPLGQALPSEINRDAVAPNFKSQITPIIWQSIASSRGSLAIVCGLLAAALYSVSVLSGFQVPTSLGKLASFFLFLSPVAVSWLGIRVFKHDGASESVRFLADRGVSPLKAYFGLQAIPIAILATALSVYGLINLRISHLNEVSDFSPILPTLLSLCLLVLLIYSVSQWVSQLVRTLILSVILAPIASAMITGWLLFVMGSWHVPIWLLAMLASLPMLATFVMMNRYMDNRDRVSSLVVAVLVVSAIILVPVAHAVSSVRSIPEMTETLRRDLLREARLNEQSAPTLVAVWLTGFNIPQNEWNDPMNDRMDELKSFMSVPKMGPTQIVAPLRQSKEDVAATSDLWSYRYWHDGICLSRIEWQQNHSDEAWNRLAEWLEASATLLPALRRSPVMNDQEIADRLEVLMIDTLQMDSVQQRRDQPAVIQAAASIGNRADRAAARRRAALALWISHVDRSLRSANLWQTAAGHQPPGLMHWIQPRLTEAQTMAMLAGIDDAKNGTDDEGWRRELHSIHQTGGVFATSRYGDAMRDRPALETMSISNLTGFGQLWGRAWESVDGSTLAQTDESASSTESPPPEKLPGQQD